MYRPKKLRRKSVLLHFAMYLVFGFIFRISKDQMRFQRITSNWTVPSILSLLVRLNKCEGNLQIKYPPRRCNMIIESCYRAVRSETDIQI